MSPRLAVTLGSLAMFLAVALGAFGAHALKGRLAPEMLATWQTGVQYHGWHALALLLVGLLLAQYPQRGAIAIAGWLLAAGIVLFSGSLYAIALTGIRGLGAITPFGGLAFLAGWLVLGWSALRG